MTDDFAQMAAQAAQLIERGSIDPMPYNIVAWHLAMQGKTKAGLDVLAQARRLAPRDTNTLTTTATLLRQAGLLRDAIEHADAALAIDPGFADAWLERGDIMLLSGAVPSAQHCYDQALALQPGHPGALAGLATVAARNGDLDKATDYAHRALVIDPENLTAATAAALANLETGQAAVARDLLAARLAQTALPSEQRAVACAVLGDAYSRLGEVDSAYRAYAQGKYEFGQVHAERAQGRQTHRAFIEATEEGVKQFNPKHWNGQATQPANAAARHVFVLGYPRSGQTLLLNVLTSLPDVCGLEERPTLRAADLDFLVDADGLARFDRADQTQLAPFRENYWDKVADAGEAVAGRTFVDMDPLKSLRLPLISRLFPDARILVMRRDPRDVVWSCFRTNFALSNAALEFTTLESTARHYDAVMRLTETALNTLPLQAMTVDYHRLVADFDQTTRDICAYTGLKWHEDMRRFAQTARRRGVSTASATQVRKGLYDGSRQWQPYAAYLAPVMPILQPWIERFGYAV